jgi:hypothetical protein
MTKDAITHGELSHIALLYSDRSSIMEDNVRSICLQDGYLTTSTSALRLSLHVLLDFFYCIDCTLACCSVLSTQLSNTLKLCSFISVKYQVSRPLKTKDKYCR